MLKHLEIRITGLVRGVFFRQAAKDEAERLGLKGLAKNAKDGSVLLEVEGAVPELEQFLKWCSTGPPLAKVGSVTVKVGKLQHYLEFTLTFNEG